MNKHDFRVVIFQKLNLTIALLKLPVTTALWNRSQFYDGLCIASSKYLLLVIWNSKLFMVVVVSGQP